MYITTVYIFAHRTDDTKPPTRDKMEADTHAKGRYHRKWQAYEEVAAGNPSSKRNTTLPEDHRVMHTKAAVYVVNYITIYFHTCMSKRSKIHCTDVMY